MATYAIGDLQGCYTELIQLLDKINFDKKKDRLWFVGDLVNRGPDSLKTIRFVKSLGKSATTVLGNHDLHLLAIAHKVRKPHRKDTLDDVLKADDAHEILEWLRNRPLLVHDPDLKFTMVHAGIPPQWSLKKSEELAKETEKLIQSKKFKSFIKIMYGDQPDEWSDSLEGHDRYRYIINCFTRTRYISNKGKLDLKEKNAPGLQAKSLIPWYAVPERKTLKHKIVFGHWSTITLVKDKNYKKYNIYPLDTGCLWGRQLTAMRLEDEKHFSVSSTQKKYKK